MEMGLKFMTVFLLQINHKSPHENGYIFPSDVVISVKKHYHIRYIYQDLKNSTAGSIFVAKVHVYKASSLQLPPVH